MLAKEQFIELLNFIKNQKEKECLFVKTLETLCPGEYVNAFIFSDYETKLINLIKIALNLPQTNTDIEYFIYDLDFGAEYKKGCIVDETKEIDISTIENLYDYLVSISQK